MHADRQPILIYGADRAALSRALERALAWGVTSALYTEDMFKTTHDAANREVVKAVVRAEPKGGRQDRRWIEIPQLRRDEIS